MRGFPRHLNTKQDYLFVKENFPKNDWQPIFQSLLDQRMQWIVVSKLTDKTPGVVDSQHRVVEIKDEATGVVKERYQEQYMEDPNCKMRRLGFTAEEVTAILSDKEASGVDVKRGIIKERVSMSIVSAIKNTEKNENRVGGDIAVGGS